MARKRWVVARAWWNDDPGWAVTTRATWKDEGLVAWFASHVDARAYCAAKNAEEAKRERKR